MTSAPSREITRQKVFAIAWPIVLSNTTVPLLGLADTFVIGNQGDAALIGAIAIGAMIFSFLYWGFGFLRMGTTGLVAQAAGAGDEAEVSAAVARALLLAAVIGGVLILLQWPLRAGAFSFIDGSDAVEQGGLTYFTIRIWGAPATLATYAILGFFIGLQDSRTALVLQLFLNALNILLDVIFVMGLHWGVAGVAAGTLIAEVLAALFGLVLIYRRLRRRNPGATRLWPDWPALMARAALVKTLSVNSDIMLRTLCLIFAFAWFTNQGAKAGDIALAANAVLMQFVTFSAFFLDGFAFSAESLVGQSIGEKDRRHLRLVVRYSTELAALTALIMSLLILVTGPYVIDALTNVDTVRAAARAYLPWAVIAPVASVWCFQLDGIFIGATRTADMRNAMALSLIVYLMSWFWLAGLYGNHGLWAALTVFYIVRAVTLYWRYPPLKEESF
ncbi:MAG: MATE family efflux transporter [Alphaproteobacteria bacterium]|nr:MAG: MATE family efflux transporter [Alphaproteobacteria bacterium]